MYVTRQEFNTGEIANNLDEMVGKLRGKADEICDFLNTGGSLSIRVGLNGGRNVADTLTPQLLSQIGALGISLTVETFPNG